MFTWFKEQPKEPQDPWMEVPESVRHNATLHEFHDDDTNMVCFFFYLRETDAFYIREIRKLKQ